MEYWPFFLDKIKSFAFPFNLQLSFCVVFLNPMGTYALRWPFSYYKEKRPETFTENMSVRVRGCSVWRYWGGEGMSVFSQPEGWGYIFLFIVLSKDCIIWRICFRRRRVSGWVWKLGVCWGLTISDNTALPSMLPTVTLHTYRSVSLLHFPSDLISHHVCVTHSFFLLLFTWMPVLSDKLGPEFSSIKLFLVS